MDASIHGSFHSKTVSDSSIWLLQPTMLKHWLQPQKNSALVRFMHRAPMVLHAYSQVLHEGGWQVSRDRICCQAGPMSPWPWCPQQKFRRKARTSRGFNKSIELVYLEEILPEVSWKPSTWKALLRWEIMTNPWTCWCHVTPSSVLILFYLLCRDQWHPLCASRDELAGGFQRVIISLIFPCIYGWL